MEKETLQEEISVHESDNAANEEIVEEDDKTGIKDKPARKAEREEAARNDKSRKKTFTGKWLFMIVAGTVLAISGLGIKFAPGLLNINDSEILVNMDINDPDLSEETLSPFFIPPVRGNSEGAIRVDLSVVWDGLASVRYRKKEIQIRSALYKQLTDIAIKNDDLNNMIPFLENRISALFRESLGAGTLVVRVKEIRYI